MCCYNLVHGITDTADTAPPVSLTLRVRMIFLPEGLHGINDTAETASTVSVILQRQPPLYH